MTGVFTAKPQCEPLSTMEPDTNLYGCIQRFEIWSTDESGNKKKNYTKQ